MLVRTPGKEGQFIEWELLDRNIQLLKSENKGEGIYMFVFKKNISEENSDVNCKFLFAEKNSNIYDFFISEIKEFKEIDYRKNILVVIQKNEDGNILTQAKIFEKI